ncbi:hypothetical protein RHMOL_Rhmol04G0037000 [Rhododendron molle]|uniref:Uncharacterized protein n=1 Tax=Rhododendron molle TaxID=49168 RepID=A0ACC0NX46_RHOML|nr:hypothetical protein RHMOL_Rhmol04G0037000 [Rhododendron molle]
MVVRVIAMVAFLMHFRLLQLAFSARSGDENLKGLWVAEKRALFLSPPMYILGLLVVVSLSTMKENHSKLTVSSTSVVYDTHALWRDLRSFGGLVLDGFLLPQILLNIFQISTKDALSRPFYIGTTCVRILPHAYDLYRTFTQFDGAYIFASPDEDFYSPRLDVVISFCFGGCCWWWVWLWVMDGERTEPVMVGGAVVWLWVLDGGGSEPVVVSSVLVAAAVDGDAGGCRLGLGFGFVGGGW